MQSSFVIRSVAEFWRFFKAERRQVGTRLEARYHLRRDDTNARMTVFRGLKLLHDHGFVANWSSPEGVLAALRQRARDLRLGKKRLAELSGLGEEAIRKILRGRHCPSMARACLLAAALDRHAPHLEPISLVIRIAPTPAPEDGVPNKGPPVGPKVADDDDGGDVDRGAPSRGPSSEADDAVDDPVDDAIKKGPPPEPDGPHDAGVDGGAEPQAALPTSRAQRLRLRLRRAGIVQRGHVARCSAEKRVTFGDQATGGAQSTHTQGANPRGPKSSQGPNPRGPKVSQGPNLRGPKSSQGPNPRGPKSSQGPNPRGPKSSRGANPRGPKSSLGAQDNDHSADTRDRGAQDHNYRSWALDNQQPTPQAGGAMHVVKCRFPDGRMTVHQEPSLREVRRFLLQIVPEDAMMDVDITVDNRPFDATTLMLQQQIVELKAKVEAKMAPPASTIGVWDVMQCALETLEEQTKEKRKEKRRHGRK